MTNEAQRLNTDIRIFLGELTRKCPSGYRELQVQVSVFENPSVGAEHVFAFRRCNKLVMRPAGTPNDMCVVLVAVNHAGDLLMNSPSKFATDLIVIDPMGLISTTHFDFYVAQIEKVILQMCFSYQAPPAVPLSTESLGELVHRMRELGECTLTFAKEKENEFWYVMKGPPDHRICIGSGLMPETALQKAFQAS